MRKPISLLCLLFLLFFDAFPQARVAISGGIHSTSVKPFLNSGLQAISTVEIKRSGLHFGFIADLPLNDSKRLSFQPGVIYFSRGTTQEHLMDTSTTKVFRATTEQKVNYIDFPLNFLYKWSLKGKTKFIVGGGPQVSLFYSGSTIFSTTDTLNNSSFDENKDLPVGKGAGQYRVTHFGLNALLGLEFNRVYLTANFNKSLTPYYEQTNKFKYTSIGATLGIYLGRQAPKSQEEVVAKVDVVNTDRDKDGIPDTTDQCPDQVGSRATNGCPDKDSDGIIDDADKCPELPGLPANNGCPIFDKDNDHITDQFDKCPDVAGIAKYDGCPIPDTDNDGINDEEDKCVNEAGSKENGGCPEIKKEIIEKVNYSARQINFEYRSDVLTPTSIKVLDEIISILKAETGLKISVEGHSSLDGTAQANLILSQKRADRVKQYMISRGINEDNITAIGFGISKPLSTGTTEAANRMNRRVEIKLDR